MSVHAFSPGVDSNKKPRSNRNKTKSTPPFPSHSSPAAASSSQHSMSALASSRMSLDSGYKRGRRGLPAVVALGRSAAAATTTNHGGNQDVHILKKESFSTLMAQHNDEQESQSQKEEEREEDENDDASTETDPLHQAQERRLFIASLFAATAISTTTSPQPASALVKAYPLNLDFENNDSSINLQSIRQERIAVKKSRIAQSKSNLLSNPFQLSSKDALATVIWGGALWLLSGSRSNPTVKPLANVLYDPESENGSWVKDRNEGLFAPLPPVFLLLMGVVFCFLGFMVDRGLLLLAEGNQNSVLQLAGVSLIGGASLELGRIASGDKKMTREDYEREKMLREEFDDFAIKRLIVGQGGSVHRNEVMQAFRRFNSKYRVENDEYPLTDLEIERLVRIWNKMEGNREGVTSAGFLKNVKMNDQTVIR